MHCVCLSLIIHFEAMQRWVELLFMFYLKQCVQDGFKCQHLCYEFVSDPKTEVAKRNKQQVSNN